MSANSEASIVCKDYVELFSVKVKVKVNLKVICILCLCIMLCDTSKTSENVTYFETQSQSVECCCHIFLYLWCVRNEDERVGTANYIKFISKL